MDLLIAAHDLHPDPESGGTGRYVFETGRRLADRGHRVTVLTRRRGDAPADERIGGMSVHRVRYRLAGRRGPGILRDAPSALRAVSTVLAGREPDVVSFQGPIVSLLAHRSLDPSVSRSCTFHSPWPAEYRVSAAVRHGPLRRSVNATIRGIVDRAVLSQADEVVTLSTFMRERLRDRYGYDGRVAVIPGGVDLDRFTPSTSPHDALTDGTNVLTVRRLAARTGVDLLLRAFAGVHESHPDAHLYVAGDGPLRPRLQRLARSLEIEEQCSFLGYVPDTALPGLYATADLTVMPTRALEGFGLSTLESLASGTPVVGTPVGGNVELLRACSADPRVPVPMLAEGTNAHALADRLVEWIQHRADLATKLACREFAEEYDWDRTVDALLAQYEETPIQHAPHSSAS